MQLAGINNISANTESGLHLTTSNLKVKADGKELCTAELQQAIDRIAAQGGGQLTFTPGRSSAGERPAETVMPPARVPPMVMSRR